MPAPIVYGLVSWIVEADDKDLADEKLLGIKRSHIPMAVALYSSIITMVLVIIMIRRKINRETKYLKD